MIANAESQLIDKTKIQSADVEETKRYESLLELQAYLERLVPDESFAGFIGNIQDMYMNEKTSRHDWTNFLSYIWYCNEELARKAYLARTSFSGRSERESVVLSLSGFKSGSAYYSLKLDGGQIEVQVALNDQSELPREFPLKAILNVANSGIAVWENEKLAYLEGQHVDPDYLESAGFLPRFKVCPLGII